MYYSSVYLWPSHLQSPSANAILAKMFEKLGHWSGDFLFSLGRRLGLCCIFLTNSAVTVSKSVSLGITCLCILRYQN